MAAMRRIARHLFNTLTLLSLVLCVAASVLWARSYCLTDQVEWRNAGGWRTVYSARGHVVVAVVLADSSGQDWMFHGPRYERGLAARPGGSLFALDYTSSDRFTDWEWAGFQWHVRRNRRRTHAIAVAPFWGLAALTAVPPAFWTIRRLASRRRLARAAGLCPACGYDLRATPDRCPECGLEADHATRERQV
jgi:hypothetical protein